MFVHLHWHCCSCISWWGRGWHRPGFGSHQQGCCSTEGPSGTGLHTALPPPQTADLQTASTRTHNSALYHSLFTILYKHNFNTEKYKSLLEKIPWRRVLWVCWKCERGKWCSGCRWWSEATLLTLHPLHCPYNLPMAPPKCEAEIQLLNKQKHQSGLKK